MNELGKGCAYTCENCPGHHNCSFNNMSLEVDDASIESANLFLQQLKDREDVLREKRQALASKMLRYNSEKALNLK